MDVSLSGHASPPCAILLRMRHQVAIYAASSGMAGFYDRADARDCGAELPRSARRKAGFRSRAICLSSAAASPLTPLR